MKEKTVKIVPILAIMLTVLLTLTMLVVPVSAKGAQLWFYSVEPPIPLPDPSVWDPNYSGTSSDGWFNEGVVIQVGDWTSFSAWIGNSDNHDTSYDTTIVISVNTDAAAGITSMTLNGYSVPSWNTNAAAFPMPPHAPIGKEEEGWYGFAEVNVSTINPGDKLKLNFVVTLNEGADMSEARIHLDAYGFSTQIHGTGWQAIDMFSPFSHDATFVIPELATILLTMAPMSAFGIYAYKRKRK